MDGSLFSGLRFRLLTLVFLALAPVVGLTLYTAGEVRQLQVIQVQENLLRWARLAANEQQHLIEGTHYLLIAMARLPAVREGDTAACNALLTDLLQNYPNYTGIAVAGRTGDLICSGLPMNQPVNVADRPYFRRVMETGDFAVGDYQIGRISGKAGLSFGYPVLDEAGQIQAVAIATLDLTWLNDVVDDTDLPAGGTVTVRDSQGIILARYPDPERWVGQSVPEASLFQAMSQQGGEGTAKVAGVDGIVRLYGFTPLTAFPEGNAYVAIGVPPEVAYAETNRTLFFSLGGIGLVAVLALVAAWLVAERFILHDVRRLLRATRQLAAGELHSRSGPPYGRGEVGQLSRAFDDMAAALEERGRERSQAEAALLEERALLARRVAERTADLSAANAEMVRAAQLKDEFLASMSHELRTPLNAILGLSEALEEGVYGDLNEKQVKSLRTIQESGRHLLELINDILDVSKIEAGKLVLEIGPVSLESVCQASLQFVKPAAQRKQQTIAYTSDGAVTAILADERRLKQILVNLLSNAVKFTAEGGRIGLDVTGDSQQQVVRCAVWDTGIGISPLEMSRLFKPFVQLDSRLSRQHAGTGLGLTLAYRMAELHGGSLSVASEVGVGSRFTVVLPWRSVAAGEEGNGRRPDAQLALAGRASPAATQRALLVEDSPTTAEQLTRYLHELGIQTVIHPQAEGVLEKVLDVQPDFIVLDILLPEPSGWDILDQLKADLRTQALPVIVVSVVDEPAQGKNLGAAVYLVKPVSRQQLYRAVTTALPQWAP
ncbi:MAG: ATP-binding protein, partial [Chloroflexota bacterium]